MENEQCGICWNLKFDKQGGYTHIDLKNFHNFVSLDYCLKCREPKYDHHGFQTHPNELNNFFSTQSIEISHNFISGIEAKHRKEQKRHRHFFTYIGIASATIALITGISNLFF